MTLIGQRQHKSLPPEAISGIELPTFTILTGPNGSGKSNLLEGIQNGAFTFAELGQLPVEQVRLFGLGQLLAAAEGPVQGAAYREPWANLYNNMVQWMQQAPNSVGHAASPEQVESWIVSQVVNSKLASPLAISRMTTEVGKPLHQFTPDDFRDYAPLIGGIRDPFAASIAEVFLTYSLRKSQNDMAQWRLATKNEGVALSDDEFHRRYGPLPWELLDETLQLVGLDYHFIPPPEFTENANYEVLLEGPEGVPIKPGDLSSGERVLLAVAMSLFTGSRLSEAIELPRVLLLDEADASLHPSMVKSLLTVIEEIFVAQYGVRVILATHSPSTVALAPEPSLFVMKRSGQRIRKASTDEALNLLTVGISALSVRLENRRQIFVESEYDQRLYQEIFSLVKSRLTSERSAEFIAAGRRGIGGGCDTVNRLVTELREAGNSTVCGIIDRDNRRDAPAFVFYSTERHSVENWVFDPLLIATLLIRERVLASEDFSLPSGLRHFELTSTHAPSIIATLGRTLGFAGTTVAVAYSGGFSAAVPAEFLETRGHDLEDAIVRTFPQLQRFGANLKVELVRRAMADRPDFVPQSLLSLFEATLE